MTLRLGGVGSDRIRRAVVAAETAGQDDQFELSVRILQLMLTGLVRHAVTLWFLALMVGTGRSNTSL